MVDRPMVPGGVTAALGAGRHVVGAVYQAGGDGAQVRIELGWGPAPTVTAAVTATETLTETPIPVPTASTTARTDDRRVWLPRVDR